MSNFRVDLEDGIGITFLKPVILSPDLA